MKPLYSYLAALLTILAGAALFAPHMMKASLAWSLTQRKKVLAVFSFVIVALLFAALPLRAQYVTITVSAGTGPQAVAANPVTNKIYVVNYNSANVTVIDGATNSTTTVSAGSFPFAVAVNPVTNQIYVTNSDSNNVTVIDGATNSTTTVSAGTGPQAVAVNPVTDKIYVTNYISNNVTVIDGATNSTTTVSAGTEPFAVAVNPVTNQIYVANGGSANVTVIDGATNSTSTVSAGSYPFAVAVNPVTNQIYVTNCGSACSSGTGKGNGNVTVIDGATNSTTTVSAGSYPFAVAVNPVTNQVYVTNCGYYCGGSGNGNVTVIDGATNSTSTVSVSAGIGPRAVALNPVTNQIYVANYYGDNVTVIDGATNSTSTVSAGSEPSVVAVNPVTNQIYVANRYSSNVTVIDGATNSTTTVSAGTSPYALAINPVTNQIYVANSGSADVTVIDGATNSTITVSAGSYPFAVAVNPVTNQIYVANSGSNNVTVIDGATNSTTTVSAGTNPSALAINPVTNQIYVANYGSANVTVIDGATNSTTTVSAGSEPYAVAVNPVTNQIYVVDQDSKNVTVIDGATNSTTTVSAGANPLAVAVNPVTNKIYVANEASNNVTVIDGATSSTTTVSVGTGPYALAINPVTNKIYVADLNGNVNVTVVDGATNSTTTVRAGSEPYAVAVNPVTNKIYVANQDSKNVTVITEEEVSAIPLEASIVPLTGNASTLLAPSFDFSASSAFSPIAPPPDGLYFEVDTWQGPWTPATAQGEGTFTGTTAALQPGFHILYAYSTDGQDATSTMGSGASAGMSPLISDITAYGFLVAPPTATLAPSSLDFDSEPDGVASAPQTLTLSSSGAALAITTITITGPNSSDFSADDCGASLTAGSNCTISVVFTPTAVGAESATLIVTDDSGGVNGSTQTVSLTGTGLNPEPSLSPSSLSFDDQAIGTTSATKKVTLSSTGTTNLMNISVAITGANAGDFPQTNNCLASMTPGTKCTINVTYTPSILGAETASLTVTDSGENSPQSVPLSGTGVEPVVLAPGSLSFPPEAEGTTTAAKSVTLTNNLPSSLTITNISASGDFASPSNTCGSSVPAKGKCTISVTFTPTVTGAEAGTLTVMDSASTSAQTVPLTGTGIVQVTVSPSSLTFASQKVSTTSAAKNVTLINNLLTALTVGAITFQGTNPGDFASPTNTCGASVLPKGKCTISVTFTPGATGTRTATMYVNDSANNSPQTVSLTGTGAMTGR